MRRTLYTPSIALFAGLLLLPQLAFANLFAGTYDLDGRHGRRGTSVELKIEETTTGELKFTRTGTFTGSSFASVPPFTWTKTGVVHGTTAYVLYYVPEGTPPASGMVGGIPGSGSTATTPRSNVFFGTYRLSASGTFLTERIVNLTQYGSQHFWRNIRTRGDKRQTAPASFFVGEDATVDNLGNTLSDAQLETVFTFWGRDELLHRRFTSWLWNDISSGAMRITDFADFMTLSDAQDAAAGLIPRGDPWSVRLYGKLFVEYMQDNGINRMRRRDLVIAVKDDFKLKAENAAGADADADMLTMAEARQSFSKPLLDLFMYLCGRNPDGDLYGLAPVPLSGTLPAARAIPNANAVDQKLQRLVQHLDVRKLSIPSKGSDYGPNEWSVSVDVVATGANTLADAEALARDRFTLSSSGFMDWNTNTPLFDGVDMLDPAAIAAVVGSGVFDGQAELSSTEADVRAKLLELVPGTDLRGPVETILNDLDFQGFRFEVLDYGAEVVGDAVIVLTPRNGTHSVVIHISYVHA